MKRGQCGAQILPSPSKQVWQRQQLERRAEAGLEKWWEHEDDDGGDQRGGVVQSGSMRGRGPRANGGTVATAVKVEVAGRKVPIDALTREEAAEMSPDEYTKFYNLAISQ